MKLRPIFFCVLFLLTALMMQAEDYFLLPETFMLHKGETINVHQFAGQGFEKDNEYPYQPSRTGELMLYEGKQKIDLTANVKDSTASAFGHQLKNSGLAMIAMTRKPIDTEIDKTALIAELDSVGGAKIYDKVNKAGQSKFRIRFTCYMKTLFTIDKTEGNLFNKELGHTLEIILQQNPYQLNYGDDMNATVKFKGKGLAGAEIDVIIKTAAGTTYPQKLTTDDTGNVYFKLSREGIYLLRLISIQQSVNKDIDFDKWGATCTFAFKNTGTLPSTYKEFGLGNKH